MWVSTNEAEDVAGSVRHALRCWKFVEEDPHAWKWTILALHAALQGACVCHLTTTAAPVGAVTKKNKVEWLEYFEAMKANSKLDPPKVQLMPLPDLLKAVRKPDVAEARASKRIAISDVELDWLKRIHSEFRNQFVHFEPVGWSFNVSGLPKLAHLIARIIKEILDYGYGFRHLTENQRQEMPRNLALLSRAI